MINLTLAFVYQEIQKQTYEISLHADEERLADGFSVDQLEFVLLH